MSDTLLQQYASFLKREQLQALAEEDLRIAREMDIPLLRMLPQYSESDLLARVRSGLERTLTTIEEGRPFEDALEALQRWRDNQLPGVSRESVEPRDLILVYAAQRRALIRFVCAFTDELHVGMTLMEELDRHFVKVQEAAIQLLAEVREEATEQVRELAKDLEREKAFAESIINNVPAGIAFVDRELVIRWANPTLNGFIPHLKPEEFLGKKMASAFPNAAHQTEGLLRNVLERGEPFRASGFHLVAEIDGRKHESWWDLAYLPVPGEDGGIAGLLTFALDVSARVEREHLQREQIAKLKQVDEMKDQFLSILSHKLRTPINAIMGFGSILDDELEGPLNEAQHLYLQKMLSGAETLLSLVNDLLDMSRIQAGKFTLDPVMTEFQAIADDVMANMAPLAEHKGHRLINQVPDELPDIMADEQRVAQVLVNLIGNAIKFTPEGGTIWVRARVAISCAAKSRTPASESQTKTFRGSSRASDSWTPATREWRAEPASACPSARASLKPMVARLVLKAS